MTEIINESMFLTEMFDLKVAKSYDYTVVDPIPSIPKLVWQAEFKDDSDKTFYMSIFREIKYGKHTRRILFTTRKNKNTTFNVIMTMGTLKKVLVTLLKAYEEFKGTSQGKMISSFVWSFPKTMEKYARLVVRSSNRAFRNNKKVQLKLWGADNLTDPKETRLYFFNPKSIYPIFGGKGVDEEFVTNNFFYNELAGVSKEEDESGAQEIQTDVKSPTVSGQQTSDPIVKKYKGQYVEYKDTVGVIDDIVQDENVVFYDIDFRYIDTSTGTLKNDKVHIYHLDIKNIFNVIQGKEFEDKFKSIKNSIEKEKTFDPTEFPETLEDIEQETKYIKMKKDSGSSSLKKDEYAIILSDYKNATKELFNDFDITNNAFLGLHVYIVSPIKNSSKYVVVSYSEEENPIYKILSAKEYTEETKVDKSQFNLNNPPAKNPNAPTILTAEISKLLKNIEPVEIGPISIKLDRLSLTDLSEKIESLNEYFGEIPKEKLEKIVREAYNKINDENREISNSIHKSLLKIQEVQDLKSIDTSSVEYYTGSGFKGINDVLRDNRNPNDQEYYRPEISKIDNIYSNHGVKFSPDLVVFRGASISDKNIEDLNNDKPYEMTSYSSASLNLFTGLDFTKASTSEFAVAKYVRTYSTQKDFTEVPFESKQGNKILFEINRLDRCLSLYVAGISKYSEEKEVLINRGTLIKPRKNERVVKVANSSYDPTKGLYFCKVSVVGAGNEIYEGISPTIRMFLEAIEQVDSVSTNLSIMQFYLEDTLFELENSEEK